MKSASRFDFPIGYNLRTTATRLIWQEIMRRKVPIVRWRADRAEVPITLAGNSAIGFPKLPKQH